MAEEIRVRHEIDIPGLERFEKALKAMGGKGNAAEITKELKEQVKALEDKVRIEKGELGIVQKLLVQQKALRTEQKYEKSEKELKRINKELYQVSVNLKKAKDTTAGWGKAMGSFAFKFNALANAVNRIGATIARGITQQLKEATKTVIEFESAMAGVKAISGATSVEFKKLRDDAIRLGGATIFTARQVATLQLNYSKLGFTTKEILSATEATLSLAAATDESLAGAAIVAGTTLRAFGLEAIEMQRVVDVMAKSFTSSALDLEKFRETMKFLAPVARSLGFTIEDTTALLAKLADTGLSGSIAGTSLRNVFLRLGDPTSKLSRAIGHTVRNGEELVEALKKLKDEGVDLAEALEQTNLRAVTSWITLINQGKEVGEMTEILNKAFGSSSEMAEIRMDTLKGSLTIMKSAWEGFVISVEDNHGPLTRHLRSVVDWFTVLINKVKELTYTASEAIDAAGTEFSGEKFKEFAKTQRGLGAKDILANVKEERAEVENIFKQQEEFLAWKKTKLDDIVAGDLDLLKRVSEYEGYLGVGENDTTQKINKMIFGDELDKANQIADAQKGIADLEKLLNGYEKYLERLGILEQATELKLKPGEKVSETAKSGGSTTVKLEDIKKNIQAILKYNMQVATTQGEIDLELRKKEINALNIHEDKKKELIRIASQEILGIKYEAELAYLDVLKDLYPENETLILKQMELIQAKIANLDFIPEDKEDADPEEGKFKGLAKAARKASDFVIDQLQVINDAEIRALDDKINRYDQNISELQRALDEEYALRREGKANRAAFLEEEIKKEQELRDKAYKQQEALEKKKRILNSLSQVSNLATASTDIFKSLAPLGPIGIGIAIATIGTMLGAWVATLTNIKDSVPVFAEGGWIDGEPHSRGGVMLNAEGGEFIVNKGAARENADMLEAMNKGDIWDKPVYNNVVKVDSRESETILRELLRVTKEKPNDFGDYIEFRRGNTITRIKK